MTVRYDDLVQDPAGTIRALYGRFGFPVDAGLEAVLTRSAERQRGWRSAHRYDVRAWGLTEQEIARRYADVYAEHGFPLPCEGLGA
jgi:hypothetical protein